MTDEQRQSQDESKLVKAIKNHINQDIKTNKELNGIDFSIFLSGVINSCTGQKIYTRGDEKEDNSFAFQLICGLNYVAGQLSKEYNKTIEFIQSAKTPAGVMNISDREKLEELDKYAEQLQGSGQDRKVNIEAIRHLTHYYKGGGGI